jgi:ATP-dependent Lhr-like helicase
MNNSLSLFSHATQNWFTHTIGTPTQAQSEAWRAISTDKNCLVSAPTGSGKTLAAFLVFIDKLITQRKSCELKNELKIIYISPLKSLAGDIRENLNRPLFGITRESGGELPEVTVAVRTGDTTSSERRKMLKTPPNILVTTPESLYLLLTSLSGREMLRTAEAVIIDELHSMISSKRGAHLMLSLARLDVLIGKGLQRIGLSATINPIELAAKYLSPTLPCEIVSPKMKKLIEINVVSPFLSDIPASTSLWQDLANAVTDACTGTKTVIAFADGRMFAEKLSYNINLIAGKDFSKTHHGCVSKEQRLEVESALREGRLRLLCATSSMELGIDVGEIDRVVQVGCPKTISGLLQRLGRSGHNPGRVSVMRIFPKSAADGFYCGLTAKAALAGQIEPMKPPRLCLDVLAQHLVSMSATEAYSIDNVLELTAKTYPFREITHEDVESILRMLAGDYEHKRDIPVRPRLLYDRINGTIEGDAYSRMLAVSAGGTIPDTGMYACKTETGVKVGELDEEYVFERNVGTKFMLGSFAWRITAIDKETVSVTPATAEGAEIPFWRNMWMCRNFKTAHNFGETMRQLNAVDNITDMKAEMAILGLDGTVADGAARMLMRQIASTDKLPDDKTIILEHFKDDSGDNLLMVHSIFGRQVNNPLALLLQRAVGKMMKADVSYFDDDDGILLMPRSSQRTPKNIIQSIEVDSAIALLEAILPTTPLFNMAFRYNAGRALMMGVRSGKRQPLWVQRLRSAEMLDFVIKHDDHPLIRETKRECLEDYWDITGLMQLLSGIRDGEIKVHEVFRNTGSPMTRQLRFQAEFTLLYEYHPTTSGITSASDAALEKAVEQSQSVKPQTEQLALVSERRRLPENAQQLHSMLMTEGDMTEDEYDIPREWFEELAGQNRAIWVEPGLWIAAEHISEYSSDNFPTLPVIRRCLRYRGAHNAAEISARYFIPTDSAARMLEDLCKSNKVVAFNGLYYHSDLYQRAVKQTIAQRRLAARTHAPSTYAALRANFPPEYQPTESDLAEGKYFWTINNNELTLHLCDDIDYDAVLNETECPIYNTLLTRGAMFVPALTKAAGFTEHRQTIEVLYSLAESGLVHADSFAPAQQILARENPANRPLKRQIASRVTAITTGRWEVNRPLKALTIEKQLNRAFDKAVILCRETASECKLSWVEALERLRLWEYTGQARRGYFVEGLSGAQFIRDSDYSATLRGLEHPQQGIKWLNACDTAQVWGSVLQHSQGLEFMRVHGTVAALKAGVPIAVFERNGRVLRIFDDAYTDKVAESFAEAFKNGEIYANQRKISLKDYPKQAADSLESAGFVNIMLDWELYK